MRGVEVVQPSGPGNESGETVVLSRGPETRRVLVVRERNGLLVHDADLVAVEEPFELRVRTGPHGTHEPLLVTMRTPGADEDLARGLLLTLGALQAEDDLVALEPPPGSGDEHRNALVAVLGDAARSRLPEARHLTATAACGVCGARSREEVVRLVRSLPSHREDSGTPIDGTLLADLPERLGAVQAVFRETGGLHAAALFSKDGTLVLAREDIGRHNAVDKVIGAWWKAGRPEAPYLLVSGRAGFEIVQKAAMAGIEALVAVGAPSSLAVELAEETGLVLAGFARQGRLNLYAGADRVVRPAPSS